MDWQQAGYCRWELASGVPAPVDEWRVHEQCLTIPSSHRRLDARGYFLAGRRSPGGSHSRRSASARSSDSSEARACRKSIRSRGVVSGWQQRPSSALAQRDALASVWFLSRCTRRNGTSSLHISATGCDPRVACCSGGGTGSVWLRNRPGNREDNRQHVWRGAYHVNAGLGSGQMVGSSCAN